MKQTNPGTQPGFTKRMIQPMEKRLTRSTNNQMIAGVAAGIANYFNVDPTIVRLIFVVTALTGGPGILAYLIMWVLMPEDVGGEKMA
jgi:phage shock protein PspC (stress-responsive transcriptional regulator)